jgi:hypothetical protein
MNVIMNELDTFYSEFDTERGPFFRSMSMSSNKT